MTRATIRVAAGGASRDVALADYLDPAADERAVVAAHAWIKGLRQLPVDGRPLRSRFTFRGDSLWWFAELYLHKTGVVHALCRTAGALEQLIARERPDEMSVAAGDRLVRGLAPQIARSAGIRYTGPHGFGSERRRLARLEMRAAVLTYAARLSRTRPRPAVRGGGRVAAFVHRAFWRGDGADGSAESYIGPVLSAIERRLAAGEVRYVAVGPASNFAARRWWHPLRRHRTAPGMESIEAFAPLRALRASAVVWRQRHTNRRALWNSRALREHAIVRGADWWPAIREELAGVALLQWPWSARAMDEAGAALDALRPEIVLTYAEAGGWGRAIMLESRRRGIASAGLQHGFIYRHWLNYLHEPDEMSPDPLSAADRGFPRPDLTLVFDGYAAEHLRRDGHFPADGIRVTGSPRLDVLAAATRALTAADLDAARRAGGADRGEPLVLVVTKYREARLVLPALVAAARALPNVRLAIKAHPAETADVYAPITAGQPGVRVLAASAPLAPLLAAARAVVTVNSTVALDAAVLGVPALVIGLPNNLTPFVDAGMLAGADDEGIGPMLERILYDEGFRQQLEASRSVLLARFGIASDGLAAERSADAILARCARPDTQE